MATFTTYGQRQDGSALQLNATDNIWLTGTTYSTPIVVGSYQDGTHLSDVNNIQRDTSVALHNTKYLTGTTVSLDGGASVNLSTLASGSAPLHFNFSNSSAVATSAATFYAWDGVSSTNPFPNITFQAAEISGSGGTNSSWTAANGSGSALTLGAQGSSTSHDFFIAVSAAPSAASALVGSVSLSLTYA